jgi:hypothetical protein
MCLGSVGPTKGESKPVPHGGQAKVGTFREPAEARWGKIAEESAKHRRSGG